MSSAARRLRSSKAALTAIPAVVGLAALGLATPAHSASAAATPLPGSKPAYATPSADRGQAAAGAQVSTRVYLAGQNQAGLAAYARAVSDPNSSSYGKYLSADQYFAQYGPSAEQVRAVTAWLTASGLSVTTSNQHYVEVSGTVASTQQAFGTSMHEYSTASGTKTAPDSDVKIPANLVSAVIGVSGLSSQPSVAKPTLAKTATSTDAGAAFTPPCSTYYGQQTATGLPAGYTPTAPYAPCSYVPSQLRKAYGVTQTGLSGKGVTVAIVDAYGSSTMEADSNQYSTNHGDKAFAPGQYTEHVTPDQWVNQSLCGGPAGWAPEESLDVEMVHGLAPNAKVLYVGANSCLDPDLQDAESYIIDNHLADEISNSWGEIMHSTSGDMDPGLLKAWEQIFQQAAVEGIGEYFSAGDCGDSSPTAAATGVNCDPTTTEAQANYPDSSPWVTSVGGTALALNQRGGYAWETNMGDLRSVLSADGKSWTPFPGPFYFGGGGGTSQDFAEPWYQFGTVPRSLSGTLLTGAPAPSPRRVTPDVAAQGDLVASTLVGISDGAPYSEAGYGGTSVSAPEFAGIQADAQQAAGRPLGFANPSLYLRSFLGLFNDVVDHPRAAHVGNQTLSDILDFGLNPNGTRRVRLYAIGQDYGLHATPGYDNATGVGSPTAQYLWSYLWLH